ncbi:MAG: hypothetical protein J5634_04135 [Bacilli bacterium]|nr:hypothetical protein [Bacilli bacterium]
MKKKEIQREDINDVNESNSLGSDINVTNGKKVCFLKRLSRKKKIILGIICLLIMVAAAVLIVLLVNKDKDDSSDSSIKYKELSTAEYQKRVNEYGEFVKSVMLDYYDKNNKYPVALDIMDLIESDKIDCDVYINNSVGYLFVNKCVIKGYTYDGGISYSYGEEKKDIPTIIPDDNDEEGILVVDKKTINDNLKYDGKNYNANGEYKIKDNSLSDFDLYFLKRSNNKQNMIYSPLAAKYALSMLDDGADGDSKTQLDNVIGSYKAKKYTNNKNMSVANALFIKNSFKNDINESYINNVSQKYDADVKFDSFESADVVNSYVSDKTYDLIKNVADDISSLDYILLNTVAIDMEWVKTIKPVKLDYLVTFSHEDFREYVSSLHLSDYIGIKFEGLSNKVTTSDFKAVANKYDIVKTLGEDNIRKTVKEDYSKFLEENRCEYSDKELKEAKDNIDSYIDTYISEIDKGYKYISSSTDFNFYEDSSVKVFAKDLKTYNGITLQYVGIMPKVSSLSDYVKKINASELNDIIKNIKPIELSSFEEGYITVITGYAPLFAFNYNMDLTNYFKSLGITDVFDSTKSNLSKLSSSSYISSAKQSTTIEFSNEGIKAASAVMIGGAGDAGCGYDYLYKVPVKNIDLTFNRPYMFIIRDKSSGEVWFAGTVYQPNEYTEKY